MNPYLALLKQEKGSLTPLPKLPKATYDSFGSTLDSHIPKSSHATKHEHNQEKGSHIPLTKPTKATFVSSDSEPGNPLRQQETMPSTAGSTLETANQADAKGQFEGRCDILVWHRAICRLEAEAMVRQYDRNRDVAESKLLRLESFYGLARCPRCTHSRQPGNTLYCINPQRSDLELSYGVLRFIPANGGATCPVWLKKHD